VFEPETIRAPLVPAYVVVLLVVVVLVVVVVVVLVVPFPLPSRCAAATTHWLNGVPFIPATCFLLRPLHACPGDFALPVASFAIAVTHCEKGVPL
jgi:hypothetical protein